MNVVPSVRVPAIHPMAGFGPDDCALHTAHFAERAVGAAADAAIVECGTALAQTVVDLLGDPGLQALVRADFEAAGGRVDVPALLAGSTNPTP